MRRPLTITCVVFSFLFVACVKDNRPAPIIDYRQINSFVGKWMFTSTTDIKTGDNSSTGYPEFDTLIFNADLSYSIIDHKDTIDMGAFSMGYGQTINALGKMQSYDSVLLQTAYITQAAVYPAFLYFKQSSLDTLSFSSYYKDSTKNKTISYYVRAK